jgi:hypothetical protein
VIGQSANPGQPLRQRVHLVTPRLAAQICPCASSPRQMPPSGRDFPGTPASIDTPQRAAPARATGLSRSGSDEHVTGWGTPRGRPLRARRHARVIGGSEIAWNCPRPRVAIVTTRLATLPWRFGVSKTGSHEWVLPSRLCENPSCTRGPRANPPVRTRPRGQQPPMRASTRVDQSRIHCQLISEPNSM